MHPMNNPGFEREDLSAVLAGAEQRLMPLRTATFVSLMLHRGAVDRHGLPLKRYFLWSDDIEYTARILGKRAGLPRPRERHAAQDEAGLHRDHLERRPLLLPRPQHDLHAARHRVEAAEKPGPLFGYLMSIVAFLQFSRFSRQARARVARGVRDGLKPGAPVPARP